MSKKKVMFLVIVVVMAIAVGVVYKRSQALSNVSKPIMRVMPVRVAEAKPGTIDVTAHYLGKAESVMTIDVTARITASVLEVRKREGDMVKAGETLIALDDITLANKARGASAEVRAAQSALSAAQSNFQTQKASFERNERLYKEAAIAQETYEQSKAATDTVASQVIAAQERIQVLEENRRASMTEQGYALITAPFDGVITRRLAEPGDMASPGKTLMNLQALNQGYKVTVQVPQETVTAIHAGSETILSDGARKMSSKVNKLYPALGTTNLATVEIGVTDIPFQLPLGSSIGVDIIVNRVTGMIVPVQAVITNSKGSFMVVVDGNDIVHPVPVQIVGRNSDLVAVTGIEANSRVVIGQENQLIQLADGKKITVISDRSDEF